MNRHSADNNDASIVSRAAAQVQQGTPTRAQSVTIFRFKRALLSYHAAGDEYGVKKSRNP
ncbi:hypothetical protein EHS86_15110 [Erwinia amylovora]|uniref:Uncharacterized protein n=2 Tax=Erwinia amylovora TaxID=552 RepID=A0A830ZZ06_ERWAM|nr:hypothetical protein AD997_00640 [Erwinia amylovora]EKV55753.1 hypothetical protein EaACW_0132 [Erwinia amylovora ACW56400]CBX78942.1 hypothetical protein predicted by Glimmer/Critica [Erwinia amylovora ATCC BAA-2158]CCO76978.1 hypothetical protein BN432_0132 [Erwinia amylovora Ea356]CCO80758.1 hypothetical protein BN433_0138 [Erwinia amylovora Ea266]CCO84567.1 hypothetical protein BN434_0130 [Erwinia amylovora CFBP 2585]CCO88353.1 hypothetical protein BN435_0132 [Erwinia amylovora 01SFR-B